MSGHGEKPSLKSVVKSLLALAIVLAAFWLIDHYTPREIHRNSLLGLGFLILGGLVAGRLCQSIGLPSLTGYLGAGLLFGPSGLTIVNDEQVAQLRLVNSLALALIAMHAGCEFTKEMVKKNFRSLIHSTWCNILIIGVGVTALLVLFSQHVVFLKDLNTYSMIVVAALFSAVAVSKSPAAVVAILGETKIKNILSEHALGIVVILDVVILILFSLLLTIAKGSYDPNSQISFASIGLLFGEIIASIAAGTFFGLLMIAYLRFFPRERTIFVVGISYGVTALCSYLHYDTLLVFVVAGFVVTNFSKQTHKMIETIESLSSVVMIVFFATAGASLHISDVLQLWQLVVVIFVARAALTWVAEATAHHIANSNIALKKYGFTPFISQAGLSIGLSMIIYEGIPEHGPKIATLAISVVTLNEIFGPIIFKWGLNQAEKLKRSAS